MPAQPSTLSSGAPRDLNENLGNVDL